MNVRPVRKTIPLLVALLIALAAVAAPAWAQQVPPSGGRLEVRAQSTPAGSAVPVAGAGCASRAGVTLSIAGQPAGSTVADAKGAFARQITVPREVFGAVIAIATCTGPFGETHILTGTVPVTDNLSGLPPLPPAHRSSRGVTANAFFVFIALCAVGALLTLVLRRRPRRAAMPPVPVVVTHTAAPAPAPVVPVPVVETERHDDLLELAAGVASALERVTDMSERVIRHVEDSRAQLQTAIAAEREDRRATLDALHELVRTIDAQVSAPATDPSASRTRSSFRQDP